MTHMGERRSLPRATLWGVACRWAGCVRTSVASPEGKLEFQVAEVETSVEAVEPPRDAPTLSEILRSNIELRRPWAGDSAIDGEALQLSDRLIGDEGASDIAAFLGANALLREVNLRNNEFTLKGVIDIAQSLKTNAVLRTLNLSWNPVGGEGASALAGALKVNSALRSLTLIHCDVSDTGAFAFAETLKVNKALRTLILYDNDITENGASALAKSLKVNKALEQLRLDKNDMSWTEANKFILRFPDKRINVNFKAIDFKAGTNPFFM